MSNHSGAAVRLPVADAAERLRHRYPRSRMPRPLLIGLVAAGAILGLAWLGWAGYVHATPAVTAQVAAYSIPDDHSMMLTLTVQRRHPEIAASCRVVAQALDYETVGEKQVTVPPSPYRLTDVGVRLVTLRRATAATVQGCSVEG